MVDWSKLSRAVFGGEGARENERRYRANGELKAIADLAYPWTVDGLKAAVREWLDREDADGVS